MMKPDPLRCFIAVIMSNIKYNQLDITPIKEKYIMDNVNLSVVSRSITFSSQVILMYEGYIYIYILGELNCLNNNIKLH